LTIGHGFLYPNSPWKGTKENSGMLVEFPMMIGRRLYLMGIIMLLASLIGGAVIELAGPGFVATYMSTFPVHTVTSVYHWHLIVPLVGAFAIGSAVCFITGDNRQ
jgi:uncharacterized membrane protein